VVADKIASDAEDLAPRKDLHFAAVDWHWRDIDRLGREAWRAAVVELDHREPRIGSHRVPRAVVSDSRNVRAPGPVQRVRTTRKYQIIGDFVAFLIHVGRDLVRERPARPQEPEIHVAGGGADPYLLALPLARLPPQTDMVTLGNVVQALFPGHVRRRPIEQQR